MYITSIDRPFQRLSETARRRSKTEQDSVPFVETLQDLISADAVRVEETDQENTRRENGKQQGKESKTPGDNEVAATSPIETGQIRSLDITV